MKGPGNLLPAPHLLCCGAERNGGNGEKQGWRQGKLWRRPEYHPHLQCRRISSVLRVKINNIQVIYKMSNTYETSTMLHHLCHTHWHPLFNNNFSLLLTQNIQQNLTSYITRYFLCFNLVFRKMAVKCTKCNQTTCSTLWWNMVYKEWFTMNTLGNNCIIVLHFHFQIILAGYVFNLSEHDSWVFGPKWPWYKAYHYIGF